MSPLNLAILREAVANGNIEWRKHVVQKLAERGIAQADVRGVLLNGDMIREYTDDKPFPSALFLGYVAARPLHVVVAACDESNRRAFVITAYEPSLDIFEADYRTKRK